MKRLHAGPIESDQLITERLVFAALAWVIGSATTFAQQQPLGNQLPNPRLLTVSPGGGR